MQGANSVPFTPDSPLLEALRQHQKEPSKSTAEIRDALMAGWTLQRTCLALSPALSSADQQLMTEFLRSRQNVTFTPFLKVRSCRDKWCPASKTIQPLVSLFWSKRRHTGMLTGMRAPEPINRSLY